MELPIIILNYNSYDDCRKCASSLRKQEGVDVELVFVDNCSADGERLRAFCRENGYTFIAAEANGGYNAGNNIGLRYAADRGYKYALIANPDMEFPQPDYLSRLVARMEEDEAVAACGGDVVTPEGVHQNPRRGVETSWWHSFRWVKHVFGRKADSATPEWVDTPNRSHYCAGLNGCCLCLRLDFVRGIGFFDERVFLYGEESILAKQVARSGRRMYYLADAVAVHAHRKSREGSRAFCLKHWKHSRMHYIKYYSDYPLYGKWFAMWAVRSYFALLSLKAHLEKARR